MTQITQNDFTIRFANVNGSGSHSANSMFARALFRMGQTVSTQNIFPSNIQGSPTWFEIRVNNSGKKAMSGGMSNILVAGNPKNIREDVQYLQDGGYLLYDSAKELPELNNQTFNIIALPISNICTEHFNDEHLWQLMKNVVFIGALSALIGADFNAVVKSFSGSDYEEHNAKALRLGYEYVEKHFSNLNIFKIAKAETDNQNIFINCNEAMALGALYGGATVAAWYPITPASSLMESFVEYSKEFRMNFEGTNNCAILQAEDESAAAGIAIGASWAGARAFTATSGPGISLMTEFLGYAYFAEIPFVLIDVQRAGPSTGMPTKTQQADIIACAYAGHGDTKNILLFPSNPQEAFEMTASAFDIADRMQTPVIVMSDAYLGMNEQISKPLVWEDKNFDRGKVLSAEDLKNLGERFARYADVDGDAIPYRTYPGVGDGKGAYFTRGTARNEYAELSEKPDDYVANIERLQRKWNMAKSYMPQALIEFEAHSKNGIICFGSSIEAVKEASNDCDILRIRSFPFTDNVKDFIDNHETIFLVEQNSNAQMKNLLVNELQVSPHKIKSILKYDGEVITTKDVVEGLLHG